MVFRPEREQLAIDLGYVGQPAGLILGDQPEVHGLIQAPAQASWAEAAALQQPTRSDIDVRSTGPESWGGIGQAGREGYDPRTVRIEKQRCIPPHAPFQCCYNNESIRRGTEGLPRRLGIARWLYDHHGL